MNLREVAKMMLDNKSIVSENDTIENLIVPILRDLFRDKFMVFAPKKNRWDIQIGETFESANKRPIVCVECKSISHTLKMRQDFHHDEDNVIMWKPCGRVFDRYCCSLCHNECEVDEIMGIGSAGGDDLLQVWGYGVDKRYTRSPVKTIVWTNGVDWVRFKESFFASHPCMKISKKNGILVSNDLRQCVVVSLRDGLRCQNEWDGMMDNLQREIFCCADNA